MPSLHAVRAELDHAASASGFPRPTGPTPRGFRRRATPEFDFDDPVSAAFDAHNYAPNPNVNVDEGLGRERAGPARSVLVDRIQLPPRHAGLQLRVARGQGLLQPTLINAERVIEGMNLGVNAFNRYSFTNRGNLDGEWQFVRTYNPATWEFYKRATPEPVPYYAYGILTRFMAKQSSVLAVEGSNSFLCLTAVRSPRGNLTIYALNKSEALQPVAVKVANWKDPRTLYKYLVTEGACAGGLSDESAGILRGCGEGELRGQAAGQEHHGLVTSKLMQKDSGITAD